MNFYGLTVSGGYSLGTPIGDAQFKNTTLLLSPTTTQAKSTTTVDSSTNALTVTRNGNPSTQWPSPYQSTGYWSGYFSGSSYLSLASNAALAFGTGDFTVESWIYLTSLSASNTICDNRTADTASAYVFYVQSNGTLTFYDGPGGVDRTSSAGAITTNTWYHVVATRSGTTFNLYINGAVAATYTGVSSNFGTSQPLRIGQQVSNLYGWNGYISNLRLVKGTAVYTSAFTSPKAPLTAITNTSLLTLQSTRFIDNSSNNFTITPTGSPQISNLYPLTTINANQGYFSGLFNGSSYLSVAGGTGTAMGTSDFTWECWVYPTASTNYQAFIDTRTNPLGGGDTTGFYFGTNINTLTPMYYTNSLQLASSINITLNAWNHVALTRASGTVTIWVNGSSGGTRTGDTTNLSQQRVLIGSSGLDLYLNGRLSNLRMVKGTVVYTTSFSPSIIPLRAIANTSLLTLQNTTFVDNSTNAFTITATGSPSTNVANPFTTAFPPSNYFAALGAGMYFNGTSDYLTAPSSVVSTIGTGAFTIEGWFYSQDFTVRTTYFQRLWSFGNGLANDVTLNIDTSGFLVYRNNDTALITASTAATLNVWYHVALVRSGSTTTIYLNGVSVGTTATSNNLTVQGGYSLYIGNESGSTRGGYFIGYMSNFRVVPGVAVYTGAFTPPSLQPLTTAGSTSALCYTSTTNVNTSFAATSTSLLLNFIDSNLTDGVFNTGQNNTFLDSGPNSFAITRNGTPTQGALTPYIPNGYWSGYFNGSTDYLSNSTNNTALAMGTGDFTIEFWLNAPSDASVHVIYDSRLNTTNATGGFQIYHQSGTIYVYGGASTATLLCSATIVYNVWNHIAFVRSGSNTGNAKLYINGSLVSTYGSADTGNYSQGYLNIGCYLVAGSPSGYYSGYLSNWRMVKGTAVYTSTFTVPTSPLTAITNTSLLTLQSNRFIDNSSNAFAITVNGTPKVQAFQPFNPPVAYLPTIYGGSGIFNGSSDYLTIPYNTSLNFTADFTVEFWVNPTSKVTSYPCIVSNYSTFTTNGGFAIFAGHNSGNTAKYNVSFNGSFPVIQSTTSISYGSWQHIALVRSGSTLTLYVNGVANGTSTQTATVAGTTNNWWIGATGDDIANSYFNGYISNFRVVKGTTVYSGTFTPPILPLANSGAASSASYSSTTNVNTSFSSTQCSLLTNFTNSGITDFTTNNNLTTVGDAKVSTTAAKYGLASFYFDGTGDIISSPASQSFVFPGNLTVEGWVYIDSTMTSSRPDNNKTFIFVGWNTGNTPQFYVYGNTTTPGLGIGYYDSTNDYQAAVTIPKDQWVNLVYVRTGTAIYGYVNGTQYTITSNYSSTIGSTNLFVIGGNPNQVAAYYSYLKGYIQDLRITKGYARYLSNFTTPTDSFTQGGGIGSVPSAPTIGTATKTNTTTATVTFTPPANTGGYAITTYTATSSIGNITGTSTTSPITISGLTSGTGYSFTVTATNSLGVSSPSAASNTVGGTAIRSFLITQMDPIYTLNTTITTAIGITKIQSYSMAILYGDD
jgi:hypothetical protein